MPINAPPEYFEAEKRYKDAKTIEEKIHALQEMLRALPKHKGTENIRALLNARLSKLRKLKEKRSKGKRDIGIKKEGDARVCILGLPNSGKSTLLKALTNADVEITPYPYATKEPALGMLKYNGAKIQVIEIPSTFKPAHLSLAHSADAILVIANNDEERRILNEIIASSNVKAKIVYVSKNEKVEEVKKKIWNALELIVVYTKDKHSPVVLPKGSKVKDLAERIHKEFLKHFRFARIERNNRVLQVGLEYELKHGDVVKIYA